MVLVAVPIAGDSAEAVAAAAFKAAAGGADLVEVRLDQCARRADDRARLAAIVAAIPTLAVPAIATARHGDEKGEWPWDEAARIACLAAADEAGAAYVDLEFAQSAATPWRPTRAKLILSHHDFAGMGTDLAGLVERMAQAGADICKIAVTALDAADLAVIEALYAPAAKPLIAIAMGEYGMPSRILAGAWGAFLTFARLDDEEGTAPGQPFLRDLLRLYRVRAQGPQTRIFGVIGNRVQHSLSPLVHNAAFASHALDAVYVPFQCEDPVAFWRACGGWIDGLSITIPHKEALLDEVDQVEPLARRIGAINTIYRDDAGRTVGANTDASAACACVEVLAGTLAGRRAIILGAGGVARAVAYALADKGAVVTITNRNLERAQVLAAEIGATAVAYESAGATPYDILINGTPSGMGEDDNTPWPWTHRPDSIVFDTVYTPLETRLIKEAQMAHATTICGLSMFIGQAVQQYQRFTGIDAPETLMQRLALERLSGGHQTDQHLKHTTATFDKKFGVGP
ncbi:MAG TPA: type I 3-dehydroquinate dehydratase [Planctomycetota bacterium]|nr:type I 3-dehydroquinate dehydratase [Planctomycetota bacterium]